MTKHKKDTASWYIDKLDILFADYIRSRGYCERCGAVAREGSGHGLQCAHVYSRKNMTLRWDPNNALCLCTGCHIYWMHKNPREFTHWFDLKYPERGRYLDENKNKITRRTLEDYKELYDKYIELTS